MRECVLCPGGGGGGGGGGLGNAVRAPPSCPLLCRSWDSFSEATDPHKAALFWPGDVEMDASDRDLTVKDGCCWFS